MATYSAVTTGSVKPVDFTNTEILSQTSLDEALCDGSWAKYSNIDANIQYIQAQTVNAATYPAHSSNWARTDAATTSLTRLANSDQVVGVALNGVFLFSGTSDYGYDAFYPKSFGNKKNPRAIEVDICLGTAQSSNTYRYHMFSPCIFDSPLKSVAAPCSSDDYPECSENVRNHSIS